tara:strand:- start:12 stop:404 length:393 start_codon:yes stop_codon:yes gene_type:complete
MASEKKNKIIPKSSILFYVIFFLLFGILLNIFYRPYIYQNNLYDFGLSDMGINISFVPFTYFFLLLIRNKFYFGVYKDIFFHSIILIFIEILSAFINGIGVFDFKDIFGIILGMIVTVIIVLTECFRYKG